MHGCTQFTDAAMVHLRGIRELIIRGCRQLSAAALAQLEGATIHRGALGNLRTPHTYTITYPMLPIPESTDS